MTLLYSVLEITLGYRVYLEWNCIMKRNGMAFCSGVNYGSGHRVRFFNPLEEIFHTSCLAWSTTLAALVPQAAGLLQPLCWLNQANRFLVWLYFQDYFFKNGSLVWGYNVTVFFFACNWQSAYSHQLSFRNMWNLWKSWPSFNSFAQTTLDVSGILWCCFKQAFPVCNS